MGPIHLSKHKKKANALNAAILFEDEASFRQDSTLHATWSPKGVQPVVPNSGQRKSIKIFGCIELNRAKFIYNRDTVFNASTYLNFLEKIATKYFPNNVLYIQDNASYHKDSEVWEWFKENRKWFEVYNLPPYSPEFNAVEPLWKHTRKNATHNKYFDSEDDVWDSLTKTFRSMQRNPDQICGYLRPFL
jgi:transposase